MSSIKRPVKCPSCKAVISAEISPELAPFCCKRCKQNDLGDWASEKFRIAAEPAELGELTELGRIDDLLAKKLASEDAEH